MKTTVAIAVAALASAMTFALPVEPEGRLFASWTAGSTESGGTSLSSAGPSTAGAAGLGLGDILSGVGAASAGGEQGGQVIAGGQSGLGFGLGSSSGSLFGLGNIPTGPSPSPVQ